MNNWNISAEKKFVQKKKIYVELLIVKQLKNKSELILTKNKALFVNLKFIIFVTAAILDEHQAVGP